MKYTIRVNEVKKEAGNVKGFATLVFGESFKITNIAILENKDKGQLFVSMPRYKSNEIDQNGNTIYKDSVEILRPQRFAPPRISIPSRRCTYRLTV